MEPSRAEVEGWAGDAGLFCQLLDDESSMVRLAAEGTSCPQVEKVAFLAQPQI